MLEVRVSEENFTQEIMDSTVPVLADFYADWCAPCNMLSPILTQIAQKYDGRLKVAKIDVSQSMELASQFEIDSIPALLYFEKGELKETLIGLVSKEELEQKLKEWGNL